MGKITQIIAFHDGLVALDENGVLWFGTVYDYQEIRWRKISEPEWHRRI